MAVLHSWLLTCLPLGPQIAGLLIAPVAFIFILYALFMYKKRTIQVCNQALAMPLHRK